MGSLVMSELLVLECPARLGDDEGAAKWIHNVSKRLVDIGLRDNTMSPFIDENGYVLLGVKANPEEANRIRAALMN